MIRVPSSALRAPARGVALVLTFCCILLPGLAVARGLQQAPPSVVDLRTEYKENPVGIDVRVPRLSWKLTADARDVVQAAYQVRVAEQPEALREGTSLVWDSERVDADQSIHVTYEGPPLASRKRYYWQVRVWDRAGRASGWSEPAYWEMGLLQPADWQAKWIEPALDEDPSVPQPAPMLRAVFEVDGDVASARAYVTSHGLYEMQLNGTRVGDEVFTPGWTSYGERLQYQTYDVAPQLQQGANAVGVLLGDGWYRGYLGFRDQRNVYGERLALLLQLEITYADGRTQVVGTDETWKATTGPIRQSDIYDGEVYDARLEKDGWSRPGYDDAGWTGVRVADHDKGRLVAPAGPPVLKIEEIKPVAILHTPAGETVFDLGQNLVGWGRLRVEGAAGTTVTMRFAEVLDQEGNLYTENLRAADQTDRYTLKGDGVEVYEPHFTFHGFRYVAVEGYPGEPTLDDLTGVVIHSDIEPTGTFETSNPLLNQLQHNIVWGQKGNFLDVPTDCPQRDERLGWTGDAQVFVRTATFNADVAAFFTKWLADLAVDQRDDGSVPHVIPDALTYGEPTGSSSAAWADASVIVPWTIYLTYGDRRILDQQYESMKGWVEYMRTVAGDDHVWDGGTHYGDWLAYATTRSDYPGATTDKDLIATAFFAHSTSLLQQAAEVLGREADALHYAALASTIREAFRQEYVTPNGRLASNTQTAYALALAFDLLPEAMRAQAADRLAEDVRQFDNHLTTGFVGTPYLTHVLSEYGHRDVAYALLNQETYPSWLYPVKQGATTIWERWDGIKPDGSFQNPGMNSFNHYAYGAIGAWMYSEVAGIDLDPAEPGYKHILIQPVPGGGLTYAAATLESMYGEIASRWAFEGDQFNLDVRVPPNTYATVRLPGAVLEEVKEGATPLASVDGVRSSVQEDGAVVLEVGSGRYAFSYPATALTTNAKAETGTR